MPVKKHLLKIALIISLVGIGIVFTFSYKNRQVFCSPARDEKIDNFISSIQNLISPLKEYDDLNTLVSKAGHADYVLLGESSHGTSEYYALRSEISKRLIQEKGFGFVVVEGDWSYIYRINQYVKGLQEASGDGRTAMNSFTRWPDWLWANNEFLEFVEWLRAYNESLPQDKRVGIYGMDVQDITDSMRETVSLLNKTNKEIALFAQKEYECIEKLIKDFGNYSFAVSKGGNCEDEVQKVKDLLRNTYSEERFLADENLFNIMQNALTVESAERYFRTSVLSNASSWNERVFSMKSVVERLKTFYKERPKAIIWAHNTHVGDARATAMAEYGMVNIGQLLREKHGRDNVFIVGFGTYEGDVLAGREWGAERQVMKIPRALEGSIEQMLSNVELDSFILRLDENSDNKTLMQIFGHRAKGVVYNPQADSGNYVATVLPLRYDAFIFIKRTTALNPL